MCIQKTYTYLHQLLYLLLQAFNFPDCLHHPYLCNVHLLELATIWSLNLDPHCFQLLQQLLSRGPLSWCVVETLVYKLHKRVLLPQLPMELLDVIPSTFHLRPAQESVWILRVCMVVGKKGAREHLGGKILLYYMYGQIHLFPYVYTRIKTIEKNAHICKPLFAA